MLLDDVRLTFLDTVEPVGDVQPVSYLLGVRVDEIELRRVREPRRYQRGRIGSTGALPQAKRSEPAKLHVGGKAVLKGRFVLCRDGLHELGAD